MITMEDPHSTKNEIEAYTSFSYSTIFSIQTENGETINAQNYIRNCLELRNCLDFFNK